MQSLNNLGFHHQFVARGVVTVKVALRKSKAYLLATQLHRGRVSSRQVNVHPSEDDDNHPSSTHVTAATACSSLDTEITRKTEMVEKLVAAIAHSKTATPIQRPLRSQTRPRRRQSAMC